MIDAELSPSGGSIKYGSGKPALLFGDDGATTARTVALLEAAGVRLAGREALEGAVDRLDRQVALGLVWLECGDRGAAPSDALLDRLARLARTGEASVVASGPESMIDLLVARLDDGSAQILVDPDDGQRAGALAVALAEARAPARVSDVGRDNAVRLRQLSDEMGRIAATLARLSSAPDELGPSVIRMADPPPDAPPLNIDVVRSAIRARRLRSRYFSDGLFADPAWDMLLDLLHAELEQHRVPVSSLCIGSAVPATTALRWIKTMTDAGLFVRRADPHDGRRVFVELSPQASVAMRAYFAEVGQCAV